MRILVSCCWLHARFWQLTLSMYLDIAGAFLPHRIGKLRSKMALPCCAWLRREVRFQGQGGPSNSL